MLKVRVAELKIGRCLADLGAIHQKPEMLWFDVFAASLKTVGHGRFQADLMAFAARIDAGLHRVFGVIWVIHGRLPR
jgi:hypothetical protein